MGNGNCRLRSEFWRESAGIWAEWEGGFMDFRRIVRIDGSGRRKLKIEERILGRKMPWRGVRLL